MSYKLKIAHISDPHFGIVTLNLKQFLSKRWIGNFNQIFNRKKKYDTKRLLELPSLLASEQVDAIFFTGDFSTTALTDEFEESFFFAKSFHCPFYAIPGNHDVYTKESEEKKTFYNYFTDPFLKNDRVHLRQINDKWWALLLDCAVATPPFAAYGIFSEEMQNKVREELSSLPSDACVVACNHFPLITHARALHDLKRATHLQEILKQFPQVKIYLHGHDHRSYIDVKPVNPLIFNAGSVSRKGFGGFNIYELDQNELIYHRFKFDQNWQRIQKTPFTYI